MSYVLIASLAGKTRKSTRSFHFHHAWNAVDMMKDQKLKQTHSLATQENNMEKFAPKVIIDGKTITPKGYEWILGFALAGCDWALKEANKPELPG